MANPLRNIAIIAHVDHGKTTLIDKLLTQSNTFSQRFEASERMMDSNDLEKERGITIRAKNTAIIWQDYRINIVDTPGHADFGGEVERVLSMVDGVLLLVDAVDGPMPQTRFVTQKAFDKGLKPIVVVNKVDRAAARCDWVIDQVFDLFDRLGASEQQLDFSVVYASALAGYAGLNSDVRSGDMTALLETIVREVPAPDVDVDGHLQMQIMALDYSSFVGGIGIGRIHRGTLFKQANVTVVNAKGEQRNEKVSQIHSFHGLDRREVDQASAGDIVAIVGIDNLKISDTLTDPTKVEALPALTVDEPTVSMAFCVNDSPFVGKEGKLITSRHIKERLAQELLHNVALRVEPSDDANVFIVSGRGELHLAILIETMRRQGFELAVGRPQVITKMVDGVLCEPYEQLTVDVETDHQGVVMEKLALRKGVCTNMAYDMQGRIKLDYRISARGLIGFRSEFLTATTGTGLMYRIFDGYAPMTEKILAQRHQGSLIAMNQGKAAAYAIFNLQKTAKFFIEHATEVYEGMVVGFQARENDLVVNVLKGKQLTNVRAAGTDENVVLTPAIRFDLEQALAFINDDELVEVTPKAIRIRKKLLTENERKRSRKSATASLK